MLFGGEAFTPAAAGIQNGTTLALADTWIWNGKTWAQAGEPSPLGTNPPARYSATMAYDDATHQLLLFGGDQGGGVLPVLGDTWIWDGNVWKQATGTNPQARYSASMAYDPVVRQLVMTGGGGLPLLGNGSAIPMSDTWIWGGKGWTKAAGTSPPAQDAMGNVPGNVPMVYDAVARQMLLHGYLRETWTW